MQLGKRPRPPMRRTTSMSEIGFPDDALSPSEETAATALGGGHNHPRGRQRAIPLPAWEGMTMGHGKRRSSGDLTGVVVDTSHFLRTCGLCQRRLGPGRDIFMYRGDIAFCSMECRQQQMNLDERKEKCSLTSMKVEAPPVAPGSEAPTSTETVVAA